MGGDYPSIQAALDATTGDIGLSICNEHYYENVVYNDRSVTIQSIAGGDTTWLDGERNGPVFTVSGTGTETLTLNGVSLMNGDGGAILATNMSVVLANSWVYDNEGAGVIAPTVTLTGTHFHDNRDVAVRAEMATADDDVILGPGFDVTALDAAGDLWVGSGDFNSGSVAGSNLTLVQSGTSDPAGDVASGGTLTNSILDGAFGPTVAELLYTDAFGSPQVLSTGSFSADPMFAETVNYSLGPNSPCVDAGTGADPDGSPADLGWLPL